MAAHDHAAEPAVSGKAGTSTSGTNDKAPHGPIRIVIRCLSHYIPGPPKLRRTTMGNLICQHIWGRDMDGETDCLHGLGYPDADAEKLRFLLDSGPPAPWVEPTCSVGDIPVLVYRWDGKKM